MNNPQLRDRPPKSSIQLRRRRNFRHTGVSGHATSTKFKIQTYKINYNKLLDVRTHITTVRLDAPNNRILMFCCILRHIHPLPHQRVMCVGNTGRRRFLIFFSQWYRLDVYYVPSSLVWAEWVFYFNEVSDNRNIDLQLRACVLLNTFI